MFKEIKLNEFTHIYGWEFKYLIPCKSLKQRHEIEDWCKTVPIRIIVGREKFHPGYYVRVASEEAAVRIFGKFFL